MTLKEFAQMLDGRLYGNEITNAEEALAKKLGFVVVFGYSDDNAELRGAIDDEIGCYVGGILEHDDLPGTIYAVWCPEDVDCAWAYTTSIPHETFNIYDDGELYCVGIVCDINKSVQSDVVEVVRCKDCSYHSQYSDENGMYHCGGIDTTKDHVLPVVAPDFFCANGERRNNG